MVLENRPLRTKLMGARGKVSYFFIALIVLILLTPLMKEGFWGQFLINMIFMITMFFGLFVVSEHKRQIYIALILGAPWIIASWGILFFPVTGTQEVAGFTIIAASMTLFFIYITLSIRRHMSRATEVTKDIIFAALSIYLMIGLLFGMIFLSIENSYPGSFYISDDPYYEPDFADMTYYSLVTMTTLGYGEITPVNPYARTLAAMEAVIGVMYMAITVATLVGMYKSPKPGKKKEEE